MNNGDQEEAKSYLINIKANAWGSLGTEGEGGMGKQNIPIRLIQQPGKGTVPRRERG